jgi:uncharacterized protein
MHKSQIATVVTGLFTARTIFFFCPVVPGDQGAALIPAAGKNDLTQVQSLLEKGADVNAKDNDGMTALMGTSFEAHFDVAKLLVEKGADVNIKSKDKDTALMAASANGQTRIVELLKAPGANK